MTPLYLSLRSLYTRAFKQITRLHRVLDTPRCWQRLELPIINRVEEKIEDQIVDHIIAIYPEQHL